ncbi:MAG: rod shape-determining protein RodA [Eubacteriales bacterium]|jgi:rod shape determining protein RodA|nr:rod shape-determining protein RodA [Eubacteriales bacterium]NCC81153.1 rod shape-determining protein RodA [Clostridia bacterium]
MFEFYRKRLKELDFIMIIALALLLTISVIIIDSATLHLSTDLSKKQIINIFVGVFACFFLLRYDYGSYKKYTLHLYLIMITGLILVPIFAPEIKGAKSWISIPLFGSLQFSELCKIIYIITYAKFLDDRRHELNTLKELLPHFLFVAPVIFLILLQPDLGTAMVFIAIMFGMLIAAGANKKIMFSLFGGGTGALIAWLLAHMHFNVWFPIKGYQLNRILVVLDSNFDVRGAGWNQLQSKIAIGNGGLLGKGFKEGTQSMGEFLPEQWTDFIFAVLSEEAGFIGAGLTLILLFVIIFRGIKIASISHDYYGSLIAAGIITMYLFHILENAGMNMGLMPITGIPLPFVSYGGSAMLANMIGISFLQNVFINKEKVVF